MHELIFSVTVDLTKAETAVLHQLEGGVTPEALREIIKTVVASGETFADLLRTFVADGKRGIVVKYAGSERLYWIESGVLQDYIGDRVRPIHEIATVRLMRTRMTIKELHDIIRSGLSYEELFVRFRYARLGLNDDMTVPEYLESVSSLLPYLSLAADPTRTCSPVLHHVCD